MISTYEQCRLKNQLIGAFKMLNRAIKEIEGCFSLPDLRDLWAENAEQWQALPGDQAGEIIRVKDRQKAEIEYARAERKAIQADGGKDAGPVAIQMDSHILGPDVPVELWPDRAMVAGVQYSSDELADLISRGISADDLRVVHEIKKTFNGEVKK